MADGYVSTHGLLYWHKWNETLCIGQNFDTDADDDRGDPPSLKMDFQIPCDWVAGEIKIIDIQGKRFSYLKTSPKIKLNFNYRTK